MKRLIKGFLFFQGMNEIEQRHEYRPAFKKALLYRRPFGAN